MPNPSMTGRQYGFRLASIRVFAGGRASGAAGSLRGAATCRSAPARALCGQSMRPLPPRRLFAGKFDGLGVVNPAIRPCDPPVVA